VRDTVWAFPVIETFHLLALAILLGTVLIVNLAAFGVGTRGSSRPVTARELEPWMLTSLCVLILSGIPMAMSEPMKCYESYSFPIKMILLVLAVVWYFTVQRRTSGKFAACISILLWGGIGIAGKGIPYV
jgi:hypothetical protein